MRRVKQTSVLLLRLAGAFIVMLLAYLLSTMVIGGASVALTPEEASQAGQALLLVSLIDALVLSFLILRSRWHGLKLVAAIFVVQFGTETFMTQIETLWFNSAVQMGTAEFVNIVAAGALRALIFAPLAVLILGKMRKPPSLEVQEAASLPSHWGMRFAALAVFYVVVYFGFGYFVAWQWEETRAFYTGTTDIKPFLTHFADFFAEDPLIIPFQLLRGTLWALLALTIVLMTALNRWQASLAVGLTFTALLSLPLGLFPNPYLPQPVAWSHFVEISTSMLLFGIVAGWVLHAEHRTETKAHALPPAMLERTHTR
jgi:hypothetical protein